MLFLSRANPGRRLLALACLCVLSAAGVRTQAPARGAAWLEPYRENAARLIKAAQADDFAWQRLAELTDTYGHRLSGSENLERAVAWAADTMRRDGLENVRTEPVMVPRWVRGRESGEIVDPPRHPLAMLGLGGSVGTPPAGLEGEVVVVGSFDELRTRSADVRGRIVLFNAPFTTYTDTVAYRTNGARAASQFGAIAALVRAVGPTGLRTPHTGSVQYGRDVPPIPAASLAAEDVDRIVRLTSRGTRVRVRLAMEARLEPDVESANVVGEIRGRERPDEIVLLGGHLDSWDVGAGASDDGVGCIVTWEAARLMAKLGIRPRRTVRVVLWTNEENGLRGAAAYATRHAAHAGQHVFALESDSGVFEPASLGFSGSIAARNLIRDIGSLLAPLGMSEVVAGGGGADIAPIGQEGNVPMMAYLGSPSRYFAIHHTPADTVERITADEVSKAAAAIATMIYVVADMPEALPK
ncbi:MAG: carboxypeptidase [Acidobacteria bacterium RIFCSPLOWO2_12_FULL_67_14]|nr:MAG: carboxypeptidase [Acidobacteria bacterium RIFCSPLOWO2_12_FULL_67_14]